MNLSICFLLEGPIDSPAYFRALGMSSSLVNLGFNVSIICDDRSGNLDKILTLNNSGVKFFTYCARPRIKSVFQSRRLLDWIKPDWVVQLNPTLKGFLSLVFSSHRLIGEWDEPAILFPQGIFRRVLANALHIWLKGRANIHISCSKAFLAYLPDGKYIPHGQYVHSEKYGEFHSNEDYFAYLGNFYPLFDHELLLRGLASANQRGFRPQVFMIGGGPDLDFWKKFCIENGLENVKFMGYCDIDQWMPILKGARALLFPMRDTPLNRCRCSSKIFAYLASERPVVAHKVGEVAELLNSVAYLAEPGVDLVSLLEKRVHLSIKVTKPNVDLSYDYLAKILLNEMQG